VVETTLGLDDGGAKKGLLKISFDPRVIDGGELVIWSGEIKGQPLLVNFGGLPALDQDAAGSGKRGSGQVALESRVVNHDCTSPSRKAAVFCCAAEVFGRSSPDQRVGARMESPFRPGPISAGALLFLA
jgi:hypothetical protein